MGKLPVRELELSQLVKSRIFTVFDASEDLLSVEGGGSDQSVTKRSASS